MSKVAEIQARMKADQIELEAAMLEERDEALERVKEQIKLYDFKATDFKGLIKSRVTQKQVDEFVARKLAEETKVKRPRAAKKTAK